MIDKEDNNNNNNNNSIQIIKTFNGDEIFGCIKNSENVEYIEIIDPLVIIISQNPLGETGVRFGRYMQYSKEKTIKIKNSFIAAICSTTDPMKEFYKLSLQYNKKMDEHIENNIINACEELRHMILGDMEAMKRDYLKKISKDLLTNFSSNTKN